MLPEIVKAVDGRVEVYLDGGIRTGTDVLKALALGARAVFVGRPAIWGLTCNVNIHPSLENLDTTPPSGIINKSLCLLSFSFGTNMPSTD